MRIVAGERKGARLAAPRGRDTRPTSDRVRESLFSLLGDVTGARVLDPFAGSGALGLEALSRGAAHADLCDVDRAALAALRENAARLRYADRCTIRRQDARRRLAADRAAGITYDLVLLDPPYAMLPDLANLLARHLPGLLAADGRAALESDATAPSPDPSLRLVADRT
ncbi:MAG TPA: RsmD family RNA methyltransferase, partial [Gaiellales bacterium]|nr:RsmD family RNA methyltransferase [Gaiellales bacterium]